jgi:hypothetical protein
MLQPDVRPKVPLSHVGRVAIAHNKHPRYPSVVIHVFGDKWDQENNSFDEEKKSLS